MNYHCIISQSLSKLLQAGQWSIINELPIQVCRTWSQFYRNSDLLMTTCFCGISSWQYEIKNLMSRKVSLKGGQ
jgi:hypothetical protein